MVNDIALIVIVLAVAIGGLAGVAYLLERRRKVSGAVGPELPELDPTGKVLLWVIRGLVAVIVLSIVGAFTFDMSLAWVAVGALIVYVIIGRVFQVIRLAGK